MSVSQNDPNSEMSKAIDEVRETVSININNSGEPQPTKALSPIKEQTVSLDHIHGDVCRIIEKLEERLEPVLVEKPDTNREDEGQPEEVSSPLRRTLRQNVRQYMNVVDRLQNLYKRIDL